MEERGKFSILFIAALALKVTTATISAPQASDEDLEKMMAGESDNHHRTNHDWNVHPEGR